MLLADAWSKRSWTQRTDQLYIAKMQGSSGDTRFTFNDDPVAPAEEASQTSPGTAESGSKSTMSRTTMSGWNMPGLRRRATASTLRSARDGAQSGTRQRSHRSPRRTPTRPGTPRAIEDQPGRTRDDGRTKRRTAETSGSRGSREPISVIDELSPSKRRWPSWNYMLRHGINSSRILKSNSRTTSGFKIRMCMMNSIPSTND